MFNDSREILNVIVWKTLADGFCGLSPSWLRLCCTSHHESQCFVHVIPRIAQGGHVEIYPIKRAQTCLFIRTKNMTLILPVSIET